MCEGYCIDDIKLVIPQTKYRKVVNGISHCLGERSSCLRVIPKDLNCIID